MEAGPETIVIVVIELRNWCMSMLQYPIPQSEQWRSHGFWGDYKTSRERNNEDEKIGVSVTLKGELPKLPMTFPVARSHTEPG